VRLEAHHEARDERRHVALLHQQRRERHFVRDDARSPLLHQRREAQHTRRRGARVRRDRVDALRTLRSATGAVRAAGVER